MHTTPGEWNCCAGAWVQGQGPAGSHAQGWGCTTLQPGATVTSYATTTQVHTRPRLPAEALEIRREFRPGIAWRNRDGRLQGLMLC